MAKTTIITGPQRHGGSLMGRLLDGHSQIFSLPCELKLAHPKGRFPHWMRGLGREKNFDLLLKKVAAVEDFEKMVWKKSVRDSGSRYQNENFTSKTLFTLWQKFLEEKPSWSADEILQTFFHAFLCSWRGCEDVKEPQLYAAHTPMLHTAAGVWCKEVPSLKIIQIVRHPMSYLASEIKRHDKFKKPFPSRLSSLLDKGTRRAPILARNQEELVKNWQIRYFLDRWSSAINCGYSNQELLGDRFLLLRYEDLVGNTRETMGKVGEFLDMPFEESLLTPNIDGQGEWIGNSSYRDERKTVTGVHAESLAWQKEIDQYRDMKVLSQGGGWMKFYDYAVRECGREMEALGYEIQGSIAGARQN